MEKIICSERLPKKEGGECPIIYAMKLIGQKWKLPILAELMNYDVLHYNELKRHIPGITNTALTRCLRELEEFGLVNRFEHSTIPPSVEYSLTDRGKALLPTLIELSRWSEEQMKLMAFKNL
ncbi:winged helix-turn-helix transcriptional regulator [Lacrimispora sp.]|uniref:winged helix-turn-helix transcriptional regulator n=1 Tax=Lacrimispora sp. TaxID=2719234 RepID=UPI002FDB28CC